MNILFLIDSLHSTRISLQAVLEKNAFNFTTVSLQDDAVLHVDLLKNITHLIASIQPEQYTLSPFVFYLGYLLGRDAKIIFLQDNQDNIEKTFPDLYRENITCVEYEHVLDYLIEEKVQFYKAEKIKQARNALLEKGYPLFDSVFTNIIQENNIEVAQLFLDAGFSTATCDSHGTPILSLAVRESLNEMVIKLILAGAPVNNISKDRKYSALMDAVQIGNYENAKLLLEHGANPDFQSEDGQTALILAVGRQEKPLVQVLLQHGADPHIKDKLGMSALQYAHIFKNQDILTLFEQN